MEYANVTNTNTFEVCWIDSLQMHNIKEYGTVEKIALREIIIDNIIAVIRRGKVVICDVWNNVL